MDSSYYNICVNPCGQRFDIFRHLMNICVNPPPPIARIKKNSIIRVMKKQCEDVTRILSYVHKSWTLVSFTLLITWLFDWVWISHHFVINQSYQIEILGYHLNIICETNVLMFTIIIIKWCCCCCRGRKRRHDWE